MTAILTKLIISILPVAVFLICLQIFDSFKLLKWRHIILTIALGAIVAFLSLLLNRYLLEVSGLRMALFTRYAAPVIEETLKSVFIIYLIRKNKIGFMVDGAIYGFALGAGFAVIENIYYVQLLEQSSLMVWVIRGFGTAVMHGGTMALFAVLMKQLQDRYQSHRWYFLIPGLIIAIVLHSIFNHFFFRPILQTLGQLIIFPVVVGYVYLRSEKQMRAWMEVGLDTDVMVLEYINSGRLSETPIGQYLQSIRDHFSGEVMVDILCYLRIYLELSVCAKGQLLMQESGFRIPPDQEMKEKLEELKFLESSIGPTGKLALAPLIQKSVQDLWQIYFIS